LICRVIRVMVCYHPCEFEGDIIAESQSPSASSQQGRVASEQTGDAGADAPLFPLLADGYWLF